MRAVASVPVIVAALYAGAIIVYAGFQTGELPAATVSFVLIWLLGFALPALILIQMMQRRTDGLTWLTAVGFALVAVNIFLGQSGYVYGDKSARVFMLPIMALTFWMALLLPLLIPKHRKDV